MLASNLKYYIGIGLIILVDSLHTIFFDNKDKYDVYLLYNHERYFTNILYDISNLFKFSVLTYFLSKYNKTVFQPFYILSFFVWASYFVFYNQWGKLFLVPIYLVLVLMFYFKRKWENKLP